jgi:hypothetical protein
VNFTEYLDQGVAVKKALLDLVVGLDADLVMLGRDEHRSTGNTVVSERAANRLMAIVALVAPELVEVAPEE